MKNKLYWIDLTLCLGWIISILGYRYALASGIGFLLTIIVVILRLTVINDLSHLEKRTWIPLLAFCILSLFLFFNRVHLSFDVIVDFSLNILNLPPERVTDYAGVGMSLWIFLFPVVYYLTMLFKKKLLKTDLSWKDLMGGILVNDKRSVLFGEIALICIGTIFAGLSMDMRMCLFMILVAPTLSYVLVCSQLNIHKHRRIGWLLAAMLLFFFAQETAGIYRISLLAISLILVSCSLRQVFKTTCQFLLTFVGIVYLGIILPSLAIGNNQYACINYAREGFYSVPRYKGIFYLVDRKTDLIGLRDRYGLILEPEYEHIKNYYGGGPGVDKHILELKKNGYTRFFDLNNNYILDDCTINDSLQKDICDILNDFVGSGSREDGCEVKITQLSSNKTLAWARMINFGNPIFLYEEDSETVSLDDDFDELGLNMFVRDTCYEDSKQVLGYVTNVPNDSLPVFRVGIKIAADKNPDSMEIIGILDKIRSNSVMKQ